MSDHRATSQHLCDRHIIRVASKAMLWCGRAAYPPETISRGQVVGLEWTRGCIGVDTCTNLNDNHRSWIILLPNFSIWFRGEGADLLLLSSVKRWATTRPVTPPPTMT